MGAMRYLGILEVKGLILCGYWVDEFFDLTGSELSFWIVVREVTATDGQGMQYGIEYFGSNSGHYKMA